MTFRGGAAVPDGTPGAPSNRESGGIRQSAAAPAVGSGVANRRPSEVLSADYPPGLRWSAGGRQADPRGWWGCTVAFSWMVIFCPGFGHAAKGKPVWKVFRGMVSAGP